MDQVVRFRRFGCLAVVVLCGFAVGCAPNGPWTVATSPASGSSVPAQLSGPGGGHVANIFICGDAGDSVEITLSGLSDDSYGVSVSVNQIDSSGFGWSHTDFEYHDSAAGDTIAFPPSEALPFSGCFNVSMSTGTFFGLPGEVPSPFQYLVVW